MHIMYVFYNKMFKLLEKKKKDYKPKRLLLYYLLYKT